MPTMRWVPDLPVRTGGGRSGSKCKWSWEASQLKQNPGRWAVLVRESESARRGQIASAIRMGVYTAFRPKGHFESAVRGEYVYVRYVGNAATSE